MQRWGAVYWSEIKLDLAFGTQSLLINISEIKLNFSDN